MSMQPSGLSRTKGESGTGTAEGGTASYSRAQGGSGHGLACMVAYDPRDWYPNVAFFTYEGQDQGHMLQGENPREHIARQV